MFMPINMPTAVQLQQGKYQPAQERAARQLSAKFLEMMLKPMFQRQRLDEDGKERHSISENMIQPLMTQFVASSLSQRGQALGLLPIFMQMVQRSDNTRKNDHCE